MTAPPVSRSADIAAPSERVWQLVTDLPGMGARSPENTGGRWTGGVPGPALGARFRGTNRNGLRRWSTTATVVQYVPDREFAFDVRVGLLPVARWSYALEPTAAGCRVTETWTDRRGAAVAVLGRIASGVSDRSTFTAASIEQTLARLTAEAEAPAPA